MPRTRSLTVVTLMASALAGGIVVSSLQPAQAQRKSIRWAVASVDTYLRFAEAVNRLDIAHDGTSQGLPEFVGGMQESGAKKKTRGALEGAQDRLKETFGGGSDEDEDDKQPARRRSSRKKEDEEE